MIKLAKGLGFTLNELQNIAAAKTQQGLVPMDLLKAEIANKRTTISQKIVQLNQSLAGLIKLEQEVEDYNECILESIEKNL